MATSKTQLFISHSTQDDGFVRDLQRALTNFDQDVWIDSRELRGGDLLWPDIKQAIEAASAYVVVVSPDALQSRWVGKELRHALRVQEQRGKPDDFPVIPISLNGTKLGVLEEFFGDEPAYIPASTAAGGIDAALNAILAALGKRLLADTEPMPQPKAEPLEELVLELTDLNIHEADGMRRAMAHACLIHQPANPTQREVASENNWRLIAPLGPIEAEELRWYLEKYAIWPSPHFADRARKIEADLAEWGKSLYNAALPKEHTGNVLQDWSRIDAQAERRFSVLVKNNWVAGTDPAAVETAREAATLLLSLPWELLHDGAGYLFQGAKPVRVRRRLPNTKVLDLPVVAPPIRVLLITARPEDESCGYIDHRASALPLVEAMEHLGGLVHLHVLNPPTLPALREELDRARRQQQPYHVVHFDGHGVYNRQVGLGGLCFEAADDLGALARRRHQTVYTDELGPLLRDHRIPLVFLEACQTAQADQASESVASDLLKGGVASVVAMSHSVLVETARRFVQAFYKSLAQGARVGTAMLAGQRHLRDDRFRGRIFGAGELRLEDWFVPVLFQEKDDPQLFKSIPAPQTQADIKASLKKRQGETPDAPETGFVGRSRELLWLQRLLRQDGDAGRYAVLRGQGGEGKTAVAAEFARWMVRSRQVRRVAFVSVEAHSQAAAVLDALGRQLVVGYSVAGYANLDQAVLPVERALKEQPTLIVVDNMESILVPPFVATPEVLSEELRRALEAILGLCARLNGQGATRVLFTSREALPAPFGSARNRLELERLAREDAVQLVEKSLGEGVVLSDAKQEEIEALVDAVQGHARTLTLLGPAVRERGVERTRLDLVGLMAEMERRFPGNREQSVFASVELSLRRMSAENRERARVLGVFHGAVDLDALRAMMEWDEAEVAALAGELIETGLATVDPYNHLSLNPALCPYLQGQLDAAEWEALTGRWVTAMRKYVGFLVQQRDQKTEIAATLTVLELPNLFALLDLVQRAGDAEATISLAALLFSLLQMLGKPHLLERVGQVRDAAAAALGEAWNHAQFEAQRTRIEQQLASGQLREAFEGAQALLQRTSTAGEQAYSVADYDLAMACFLLAHVLKTASGSEQALPLLDEARRRFEAIVNEQAEEAAEAMASISINEKADCLRHLGRLDEAASAYEEAIHLGEKQGNERDVAVSKGQLGTVRLLQRRYEDALDIYAETRERFAQLDEPGSVAGVWHQTGNVYMEARQPEAAQDAYQKSLEITVRLGDIAAQARTLNQLGLLYGDNLDRTEEAITFLRQAANKYIEIHDAAKEGITRSNLAIRLHKLRRYDEARQEINHAIKCKAQFSYASAPWTSWNILAGIETDTGNHSAAAEAKRKALDCYLAYRRDGGENHLPQGRLALAVTELVQAGNPAEAIALLQQVATDWEAAGYGAFIQALQAIVAGSRDPSLADAPDLHYTMAAEILLLIEALEAGR